MSPEERPMSPEERLLESYPDCREAVAWCEVIVARPPEGESESSFDLLRRADPPLTFAFVLDVLQVLAREEAGDPECSPAMRAASARALAQMDTAGFAAYLRGRLGMM